VTDNGVGAVTGVGVDVLSCAVPMSGADLVEGLQGQPISAHVVVLRDPRTAVGALMAAWESRRFAIDPQPEGWWGEPWAFTLIDDWQALLGRPLAEVCANQWLQLALTQLRANPDAPITTFEALVADPRGSESTLTRELGIPVHVRLAEPLDPYRCPHDVEEVMTGLVAANPRYQEYLDLAQARAGVDYRGPLPRPQISPAEVRNTSVGTPFHSASTATLPDLLQQLRASLVITTYKTGQVIIARTADGLALDTYLTPIERPMGIAVSDSRLAIGTADGVSVFARHAATNLASIMSLDPAPDAVFIPKASVVTGDVAIHDLAWGRDGQLWFVNSKFSCLSTLQPYESFNSQWRPHWITRLAAEDRCHLNGLGMVDGEPTYVTALAMSDQPQGWREQRGTGGVIVHVPSNDVVATGLCMPHSPRWYDQRLWFLQSGLGSLCVLDPMGAVHEICRLPGFTRGLAFAGPYAFIGLSQVRESVFTNLPITDTANERNCGVWVVDTRTAQTVGFLRFSAAITEIYDVQLLAAQWPHLANYGELTRSCYVLDASTIEQLEITA